MELAVRMVNALEKLAETPVLETEGGPPICPHCNTFNPEITIPACEESSGPLIQYALDARCGTCGKVIYGVPIEWALFTTVEEAEDEVGRRAGMISGNGSDAHSREN